MLFLEKLCNTSGVSGDEWRVRELIEEEIKPYADSIKKDAMGNMIAFRKGEHSEKRLMVCAHMDEVGFIISGYTDKGYLKFKSVGGIDPRVVISKNVIINDKVKGVIGIKAIHLLTNDEMKSVPKMKDMYIDIGAKSKEEAEKFVSIGDYATFTTRFTEMGKNKLMAKAFDDRVGCYLMSKLIKSKPYYDTYFCFTTQEETGLRGAIPASYGIDVDEALVLEATTCADVHGTKDYQEVTINGGGAAITFMDGCTIIAPELYKKVMAIAKENSIPVQFKRTRAGGNDAGVVHISKTGIKTLSVSVPARYIHSPVSIIDKRDIDSVMRLCELFVEGKFI